MLALERKDYYNRKSLLPLEIISFRVLDMIFLLFSSYFAEFIVGYIYVLSSNKFIFGFLPVYLYKIYIPNFFIKFFKDDKVAEHG